MVKKADPSSSEGLKLSEEDRDALALEDAFYEKQYTRGTLIGAGSDYSANVFDYINRIGGAKLLTELATKTSKRAQDIIDTAGEGAEERLETARGAKMAAARGALDTAAKMAAMDPTGTAAIELTRKGAQMVQAGSDMSAEETREMDRYLKERRIGEEMKSEAEQLKMKGKHDKQTARLQLAKDTIASAATLGAALKPSSYEAGLERKAARGEAKSLRQTKRQKKLAVKMGTAQTKDIKAKVSSGEMTKEEGDKLLAQTLKLRQKKNVFGKTRMERYKKAQTRKVAGLEQQAAADQSLDELFKAKMAKFNAVMGQRAAERAKLTPATELADTMTPKVK